MVSEQAIEASLAQLADETAIESAMIDFAREQTPYLQYLRTEGFDLLTDDERDYLQYLALVVYASAKTDGDGSALPTISGEDIESWDERCWTWIQDSVGKPMRERLDTFFDHIDEEELLAFAEDSLVDPKPEEGEDSLFDSGASRELGIVALGVLIGGLTET